MGPEYLLRTIMILAPFRLSCAFANGVFPSASQGNQNGEGGFNVSSIGGLGFGVVSFQGIN